MLTVGFSVPTSAQSPILVDDNNADCPNASHGSVQAGVDAAFAGDTVVVCAGTYQESVTIPGTKDGLTLEADSGASPTLVGPSGDNSMTIHVEQEADGVTIRGLTITNPDGRYGVFVGWYGGDGPVDTRIVDNTIEDLGTSPYEITGVIAEGGTHGTEIVGNTFRSIHDQGGHGRATAVSITSPGVPIQDARVANNTFEDLSSHGDNTKARAIEMAGPIESPTVAGNTITDVGDAKTDYAQGMTIIEDTLPNGEVVGPTNFTITGNQVENLSADGDYKGIGPLERAIFIGGYEDLGIDHIVKHNSLLEPVERFHGGLPADADALDAPANWWGSPLGPTHDDNAFAATGLTGSETTDFVDYEPWCESSLCLAPLLQSP